MACREDRRMGMETRRRLREPREPTARVMSTAAAERGSGKRRVERSRRARTVAWRLLLRSGFSLSQCGAKTHYVRAIGGRR